jgi:hypothetical protein
MCPAIRLHTLLSMELSRTPARWVGALGVAWVIVFLASVGGLQGEPPAADAPLDELRTFFADNGARYLLGDYLAGLSFMLLFIPFIVLLPRGLGITGSIWPRMAAVGAAALVAVGGTATSFLDAVAIGRGDARIDDGALAALLQANTAGIALIGLPAALVALSIAGMLWTPGALGDSTGRPSRATQAIAVLGWIAAGLLTLGAAFPIDDDQRGPLWTVRFSSFVVFALLVLITSVLILTQRPDAPATARDRPEVTADARD